MSRGEARSRVDAAADVLPGRGRGGAPVEPKLPATAAAVAEHAIGAGDVAVIRSVLSRIPTHVPAEQRAEVEVRPPMSRSTCALLPNVTLTPWSSSPSARWPTVSCPPRAVNAPRSW